MKTDLADAVLNTPEGLRADAILRKCVHCGFCNATCPTYQLLGDELDGPRGRIYLIKSLLEGNTVTQETQLHLDRCLTCRSCETTCPSGVEYSALLDIGRSQIEKDIKRPWNKLVMRKLLMLILPNRFFFTLFLGLGQMFRPILPATLKARIPQRQSFRKINTTQHERKVVLFQGCVQPAVSPDTNLITESLLDQMGISVIKVNGEHCCGALHHHLGATRTSRKLMKKNIDLWWSILQQDAEAIITTASGCGMMIKEYAEALQDDPCFADKARYISERTCDIGEFLAGENRDLLRDLLQIRNRQLVFQSPCSLQHGQKLDGVTESLLSELGVELTLPQDPHLCCGSAGTYSILQPEISEQLRENKLKKLTGSDPDMILTANIGCQLHLQQTTDVPVKHWIALFEEE